MLDIDVADQQSAIHIDPQWFAELARWTLEQEGIADGSISVAFVDEPTIHRLNREFLDHDYPTDVISFPLSDDARRLQGEVVISTACAVARSGEFGWPAEIEAGLYLVHGLLHLCGHDDQTPERAIEMAARQEAILAEFYRGRGMALPSPRQRSEPVDADEPVSPRAPSAAPVARRQNSSSSSS